MYGLREGRFRRYVDVAKSVKGVTGDNILELLERRLDATLFRGGLSASRDQARQLINHGLVAVNGRRVDIASFMVRVGDVIEFKEGARGKKGVKAIVEENAKRDSSSWLDQQNGQIRVLDRPKPDEFAQDMKMHLIVEFYSR
jgi:small subunit ribosomal protein S4